MMILAGEAVGELGRRLGVPLPYRGQARGICGVLPCLL